MTFDKSRMADPKETQDDEGGSSGLFSFREAWADVVKEVEFNGYLIRPDIEGAFCGHAVYKREHQVQIPGIQAHDRFWYWKPVDPVLEGHKFFDDFKEICEDLCDQKGDSKKSKVYMAIAKSMMDEPMSTKSPVFQLALSAHIFLARENTSRTVTLNGTSGHFKVVPPVSWFPEAVQKLDARRLLTLYPDAEARQMMLLLGRCVVGASGTKSAEGLIEHTARSYGITVGTEAGLGKSTFHNYVIKALELLGFQVTNVHLNDTKFGWASIARADLAYVDDLTDDVQKRLLADVRVKSIVSNNNLKVEEKGLPAQDVRATSLLLGCTNLYNPSHFIGMDSGSTSRVNQLDTYNSSELARVWTDIPDARTKPHWENLAETYGVTTDLLAAYLLRRSADYFLETCGYTWDDGRLFKDRECQLEVVTKANRQQFRLDTSLRHLEELVTSVANLVSLAIAKSDDVDTDNYLKLLEYLDFSPSLLVAQLRLFSAIKSTNKLPECYAKMNLDNASWDCKSFISKKLADLDRVGENKNSDEAFTVVIKELKSNKGFGYPQKTCHYTPQWLAVRRMIPNMVAEYKQVIKTTPLPQPLRVAVAEVQGIFNELQ